ncbi:hypothetical protein BDD43_4645 [Mucilaginibacter gracilis]|uniref:Uncharacterized protein n=1 Tax=Mucilaginibacter gracilis TaxID=423350 RepID=A0A495J5Z2_9SPHI|nr:hypothetical protein [Mucilaginibacter gracilis]RKR84410.1 hypothetical protein BDD43_4645 [Mucilaginibacter gracilis]
MDTKGKNEAVNNEVAQVVLEDLTKEQKINTQAIHDLVTAVNGLGNKMEELKSGEKTKKADGETDYRPALDRINNKVTDIKIKIDEWQAPKKFQILLFPEQDRKLFYKIVFGRWLLYLVIMLFLNDLCKWGMHYSDTQKEIKLEQLENDHIRKSWDYLYNNNGRAVKKLMNEAYDTSERRAGK